MTRRARTTLVLPMRNVSIATIVCLATAIGSAAQDEKSAPTKPATAERSRTDDNRVSTNGIGMRLVLIPPGEFMMGSPEMVVGRSAMESLHKVRITIPFCLGETEVTRGEFQKFVDATKYRTEAEIIGKGGWGYNAVSKAFEQSKRYTWLNPGFEQGETHPVVNVSEHDIKKFLEWLSEKEERQYRLPTEAEWEYACRAGTQTAYCCGDAAEALAQFGNVADGSFTEQFGLPLDNPVFRRIKANDGYVFTAPVRQFRPNGFGLYDMHGNVSECCEDEMDPAYYKKSPTNDPTGPARKTDDPDAWFPSHRVIRGGRYCGGVAESRSAQRAIYSFYSNHYQGFRVACTPGSE